MGNGASQGGWSSNYEQLKGIHDEAYKNIDEAITLEEQERPNDAVEKYKQGIITIDKALSVVITCPENPDSTWEQACGMVQKMKKTRAEVLMRITSITSAPDYMHQEPPPSYEDAMSTSSESSGPRTYIELAEALDNLHINTPRGVAEIIYTHDGVRLYFISSDGTVLSTTEAHTLNIALIDGEEGKPPTAFLQVGSWVYPLIPGVSPCYRTDYGAFILPDLHSDIPGSSVGIILPEDADGAVLELFENILHGVVIQDSGPEQRIERTRRYIEEPGISGSISRGIIAGAILISKGLIYGAQKAGDLINYSTPKLIGNIQPASAATAVPENVSTGLKFAGTATSKAAEVTGFVAEKVGVATSKLGHFLAPHIHKQGTKLLTTGFNMSEEDASNKMKSVLTVAAGAVEGFATVYQGLETSASILGQNLKENSVKIVEHKYGNPAGEAANDTFSTVGNLMTIRSNAKLFTPKGFAKSTVKQTGKAVVFTATSDLSTNKKQNQPSTSTQPPNYIYPNLQEDFKDQFLPTNKDLDKK